MKHLSDFSHEEQITILKAMVTTLHLRTYGLFIYLEMAESRSREVEYSITKMNAKDRLMDRLIADLVISTNGIPDRDEEALEWLQNVLGDQAYEKIEQLRKKIGTVANTVAVKDACWNAEEPGDPYCESCFQSLFPGIEYDSSSWTEEDAPLFCENCGALLSFTLTEYGAREEIDYFAQDGNFDRLKPHHFFILERAINSFLGSGAWKVSDFPKDVLEKVLKIDEMLK